MRGGRWWGSLLVVAGLLAACSSTDDAQKDTPETRCTRLCAPSKENPCYNESTTDTACKSTCLARLTGKSDACQSCVHVESGWIGTSCKCDDAFGGFGSATCKTCKWKSSSNTCGTDVGNSCDTPTGCAGFQMLPVGDPQCADACGETPIVDAGAD